MTGTMISRHSLSIHVGHGSRRHDAEDDPVMMHDAEDDPIMMHDAEDDPL